MTNGVLVLAAVLVSVFALEPTLGAQTRIWQGLPVVAVDAKLSFPVTRTDAEWKKQLGDFAYFVLREQGTERIVVALILVQHRRASPLQTVLAVIRQTQHLL